MVMDILTVNDKQGEYPKSWYAATANSHQPFNTVKGDLSCDVCVVGGGYTGLSAALHLARKGFDVVLLEAHRVGWGASGRNGGQVGTGQRVGQTELERMVGQERARELWSLSLASTKLVKDLIATHNIECDYTQGIIHADHRKRYVADSHTEANKLINNYGYDLVSTLDQNQIHEEIGSDTFYGGTLDKGSAHLHPLNYALGLAAAAKQAGVSLFENSRVSGISPGEPAVISTEQATIKARYVVLACNGYLGGLQQDVAPYVMPINNYIVATEPLSDADATALIKNNYAVADSRFVVNYFRLSRDKRMLFGGGESYRYRFPADIASLVTKPMLKVYPQLKDARIDYAWGGTLGITMNRMPHFSRIKGNVLSTGGYSGHGVAMATLAGSLMADAIDGQAGAFDVMQGVPSQRFPGGTMLRLPLLALGMTWYALRDKL